MRIKLRPWTLDDAKFVVELRNHREVRQWFRQDHDLTLKEQKAFMESEAGKNYRGLIIEADGKPAGMCNLDLLTDEFGIAVHPAYQKQGISTKAMRQLLKLGERAHSEVFVKNPALSWYLYKLGFKAVGVRERAYWKVGSGFVDVVIIERGNA